MDAGSNRIYRAFGKRLFDIAVSLAALALLGPVLLFLAFVVRISLGRPVIFRQARAGHGGRAFHLLKFRTMTEGRGLAGDDLSDDLRLTRVGRFLRKTSLDELLELYNVLRGDMSLVGPRPLLLRYRQRYTPEQARRHEVKPGVTGWAQVNGRNAISWQEKFELDVWYVDHLSFPLDLRILIRTLASVLRAEGISEEGHATMTEFLGDASRGECSR